MPLSKEIIYKTELKKELKRSPSCTIFVLASRTWWPYDRVNLILKENPRLIKVC